MIGRDLLCKELQRRSFCDVQEPVSLVTVALKSDVEAKLTAQEIK